MTRQEMESLLSLMKLQHDQHVAAGKEWVTKEDEEVVRGTVMFLLDLMNASPMAVELIGKAPPEFHMLLGNLAMTGLRELMIRKNDEILEAIQDNG